MSEFQQNDIYGMDLYMKAISKYGEEFRAIFSILPDEIIQEYLRFSKIQGLKKLRKNFSQYIDRKI